MPKSQSGQQSTAKKAVTVSIDEKLNYFVDKKPTSLEQLQSVIETYQKVAPDLTIILYVEKSVPAENIMKAYDVANKLKLKLVLAVDPKK